MTEEMARRHSHQDVVHEHRRAFYEGQTLQPGDSLLVQSELRMMSQAQEIVLLVDSGKFDQQALTRLGSLSGNRYRGERFGIDRKPSAPTSSLSGMSVRSIAKTEMDAREESGRLGPGMNVDAEKAKTPRRRRRERGEGLKSR